MRPDSDTIAIDLATEIELLRRIGQGDREAFAEFYDRLSGVLYAAIYRVLNNTEASEDVLQEVFLMIWEKAPHYDPARGKPLTWAVTLARNKAIDRLRAVQRRLRLGDQLEHEAQTIEHFDDRNALDAVESDEKGQLVRDALRRLSKDQREALQLAFFSGLTQVEIAEHLQQPLGTVKARIRRGMMRLRTLLSSQL